MQINIIQNFFCSISYVYHLAANPQPEEAKYLSCYRKLPGGSSVHILSAEMTLSRSTHQKPVYAVVKKIIEEQTIGSFSHSFWKCKLCWQYQPRHEPELNTF